MPKKVKVIFFDAGGTLFKPYPSVGEIYSRMAQQHGVTVPAEEVDQRFQDVWHARNGLATLVGPINEKIERNWWYGLVQEVFSVGTVPRFKDFDAFFAELYDLFARPDCWRLFPDVLPLLDTLKQKGYSLGMISNWDHRLFSIVEGLGLTGYFKHIAASAAVGTAKPGRAIFEAALHALDVEPGNALHIGDSVEEDYHGARRSGLQAILLDRHRKAYNGIDRIETLSDLLPWISCDSENQSVS